jgi:predicted TIM-barrel fold metal-dependent hydrolase
MRRYGIRIQMLSISDPGVSFVSGSEAVNLARQCNEYATSVAQAHPGSFGAFAVVPLPQVDAALAEVGYALDTLGHDGVGLLSSYQGKYLGDPSFESLLAELDRRRAWVFVHPTAVSADDKPSLQVPDFVYEYPFDTARTIVSLLFNASFKRYPHIRWHFAHGGGAVSMLRFRLEVLAEAAPEAAGLILPPVAKGLVRKDADDALAGNFYDTALIPDPPELEAVRHMTGYRHMLFGSDWPFASRIYATSGDPAPLLSSAFTNSERHAVERLNAVAQFPRLRDLFGAKRKEKRKPKKKK